MSDLDALALQSEAEADAALRALEVAQTKFAARVRNWFVEAYTSKYWTDYRKYADEDMGFYTGENGGQWSIEGSKDDYEKLKAEGRAYGQNNHVQPVVDVITGYERQNRYDLKTVPTGNEDAEDAQAMTLLLKHVQEQTEAATICSEVFENTVITGLSAVDVGIDWTRDPVQGDITIELLTPGKDVMWDPNVVKKDAADARYMLKYRTAWVEDIIAQYPKYEKAIRESIGTVGNLIKENKLSEWSPVDGYGGVTNHPKETADIRSMFYDPAGEGRLLIIEAWYVDYQERWLVADKRSGTVVDSVLGDDGEKLLLDSKAAKAMAEADPKHLTAIRRMQRVIVSGVVLPGLFQTLEEDDTPYENDQEAYPIIPCIGKRKGDYVYGIVRNIKDPQRNENKRRAQMTDLVSKIANLRIVYEQNSLENPQDLMDWFSPKPIAYRTGHQPPAFMTPPLGEIVNVLRMTGDQDKMSIRENSGINTELLGLETDQSSGIAIARRQAQGQVISTGWFDNYRYFRKVLGKRLARRIQQVYTTERTIRVIGPDGAATLVTVNPADAMEMEDKEFQRYKEEKKGALVGPDQKPTFLRNKDTLKYDVTISEVPTTPTARATSLLAILEILKVMPGLAPILDEIVLELAEIPERGRILQMLRAMKSNAAGMPPGGPTTKGAGAPVPPAGAPAPPTTPAGLPTPEPTTTAI